MSDQVTEKKFRTALIGVQGIGREILSALSEVDGLELFALADRDPDIAEQRAESLGIISFDDYRQLAVRKDIEVIIAAEPLYMCAEQIKTALGRGCHVIKPYPPALNFEQAAEFVNIASANGVLYFTATAERYSGGFSGLREYMRENDHPFELITAVCNIPHVPDDFENRWLNDPAMAGGGVLLHECYPFIEQINLNFGLCERVFCLTSNRAPDTQQRLSITEDTAALNMQFSDTLLANVVTSRIFGPVVKLMRLHRREGFIVVSANKFEIYDNSGETVDKSRFSDDSCGRWVKLLEDFILAATRSQSRSFKTDEHNLLLENMSLIQSAYLSSKTSMPEEPGRIVEPIKNEISNIMRRNRGENAPS